MDDGWVKTYRKLLNNPIVTKDADHFAIWMWLMLSATHQPCDALHNGKRITLQPGQLVTGRKKIAEALNIRSESKIERVLNCFESEQQIEQQKCSKNRLITILQWELYQESEQQNEQQVNNNCTTSEHINKNERNIYNTTKKEILKKESTRFSPPSVCELADYIAEKGYHFDAESFIAYYESNGWKVGKNPMKNWKSACTTWEKRRDKPATNNFHNFEERREQDLDYDVMERFNRMVGG